MAAYTEFQARRTLGQWTIRAYAPAPWWRRVWAWARRRPAPAGQWHTFIGEYTRWHRVRADGRLRRCSLDVELQLADVWETAVDRQRHPPRRTGTRSLN